MSSRDAIKITVAVLKVGEQRTAIPNLKFPDASLN